MISKITEEEIKYFNNIIKDYKITINPFSNIYVYKQDKTIGFIDYSIIYDRIELNFIYVIDEYRNNKIASILLDKMFNNEFTNITLEVNVNNIIAIKLYEKYGFKTIKIIKGYYQNEDGLLMELKNKI